MNKDVKMSIASVDYPALGMTRGTDEKDRERQRETERDRESDRNKCRDLLVPLFCLLRRL